MKKYLTILISLLIVIGCSEDKHILNPKSIELNNKAIEIMALQKNDSISIDSTIKLLDQATNIDSLYTVGYMNKLLFLMKKKDFLCSLVTIDKIIELRPKQPNWIIQKGLILELSGEVQKANNQYNKGIKVYEELMGLNLTKPWEFKLEFAQNLIIANDSNRAREIVKKLKKENPNLEIWKSFKLQTKDGILQLIE